MATDEAAPGENVAALAERGRRAAPRFPSSDQAEATRSATASTAAPFEAEPAAYIVGWRRPPVATRFRLGQSGNPKGRPKGARDLATIIAATLGERVAVNENDRRRRITKLEAAVMQLVNRAAGGETRMIQLLLALVQTHEARAGGAAESPSEGDFVVMAELRRRLAHRP